MNFASIFALIFKLAIPTVLTIQQIHGDAVAGVDKKTMANEALSAAAATAMSVLPSNSQNAAYANIAASIAPSIIDAVVSFTKATGQYQAATANPVPIVTTGK